MTSQKDPCTFIYSCTRPLGRNRNTGAHGELDSGDGAHRRRGERGGGARGGHGLPRGGLGAAGGDWRRAVRGGRGPAAVAAALLGLGATRARGRRKRGEH